MPINPPHPAEIIRDLSIAPLVLTGRPGVTIVYPPSSNNKHRPLSPGADAYFTPGHPLSPRDGHHFPTQCRFTP